MRIAAPLLAFLVLLAGSAPAAALAAPGGAQATAPLAAAGGAQATATLDAAGGAQATTETRRAALAGPSHARIETPTVTEIYVAPTPDGSARWNVSVRYNLSSDADRAAFDRYGRAFEAGDTEVGLDVEFFRTLASEASRATGREMTIRRPERSADRHNDTGVLRLSFTWTNFATDTEDGFRVQEAVLMPDNRTWLSSIGADQRLVVETPPGYRVTDTRFGLENGSVVVDGPHTFREPLTISYQQTATEEPGPDPPWLLVAGALLVGLGLVAAVVYARRSGDDERETGGPATAPDRAGDADEPDGAEPESAEPPAETDSDEEDGPATGTVDPSLLSDEERVERLLDRNGGRMKQARIVQETGWSDAKVSQLLSTMAEEGRVEKLRLGRENLISLPDEEP